jgi:biotin synthase
VRALFELPFPELLYRAQTVHRQNFDPAAVQVSTLLSIKTGGCPEDCAYCPQSARYETGVRAEKLMGLDAVLAEARAAKTAGASRFCMGAAWREPKDRDLDAVCAMVAGVKDLGLETCATLGMLTPDQAFRLKHSGLDYYNHNLDTAPEFYGDIISTRTYADRLATLDHVRAAGIHVCCGGIVGMGETREHRVGMIATLASLPAHPESVPINMLVRVTGTPLADAQKLDALVRQFEGIARRAKRKLEAVNAASRLDDLMIPPSNRLERLKGDLKEYYSIRINDQWRVTFKWINGEPHEVRVVDYH